MNIQIYRGQGTVISKCLKQLTCLLSYLFALNKMHSDLFVLFVCFCFCFFSSISTVIENETRQSRRGALT